MRARDYTTTMQGVPPAWQAISGKCAFDRATTEAILKLRFADAADNARVAELVDRCNAGMLSGYESREYEGYVAVADVLAMLQSEARLSIKQRTSAA